MRWLIARTWKQAFRVVTYGVVGALLMGVSVFVVVLERRPDLEPWHTVHLDEEFTTKSGLTSFDEYRALEDRLFAQLDTEVYTAGPTGEHPPITRYFHGSLPDPGRWPTNWNRSFELSVDDPRVGVLLLHGLSDAPYSMRSLAESLHAAGAHVVGLRVPGHGTAPSGLVDVEWRDMAAAVRIAMAHLKDVIGDRPLLMVGYSNGGALTVEYALSALEDDRLPPPDRIVLLSPEIGITKLAALAVWQERLGHLLGLHKLAWNSILPEYDPYKYGSFAMNAGIQAYSITNDIQSRISELGPSGALERFPPTLAFQSVADATVSAPALVTRFLDLLPSGGHELVLFDINRIAAIEPILKRDYRAWLDDILNGASRSFSVSVVVNESAEESAVVLRQRREGETKIRTTGLGMRWPTNLYSLSHVALPFPPDDPVNGGRDAGKSPGIQLGKLTLRGERGVLEVGAAEMLRLRWNPFHSYIEQRVLAIVVEPKSAQR